MDNNIIKKSGDSNSNIDTMEAAIENIDFINTSSDDLGITEKTMGGT